MPGDEVEAITESAKAVQEVAKLGGKALDIGRGAGGWLNHPFGQGIEDAVALHWSDRVRARRIEAAIYDWERLTALFHKVDARLNKKGVSSLRLVPPKIVLALIENATVEYEDDLHTLWANLLATGLDATADEIQRQYVSILSNLSSNDRELLNALCLEWTKSGEVSFPEDFRSRSTLDEISLITLNKFGLVAPKIIDFQIYGPETTDGIRVYPPEKQIVEAQGSDLEFTPLGIAFCKAVILE